MASATVAVFSSQTKLTATHKETPPSLSNSKTSLTFFTRISSFPSLRLPLASDSFSPIVSRNSTFPIIPKSSDSEAPVIESDPESGPTQIGETTKEVPKHEEVFAVVMVGSRQYIVFPGRYIYTQRLKGANVNDKIILNKVLLVGTRTSTYIGKPVVPNAAVHAIVEEQGLDAKVIVYKYKRKKNYRRNIGHRQPNTRIRIIGITGYQDSPAVTLDA